MSRLTRFFVYPWNQIAVAVRVTETVTSTRLAAIDMLRGIAMLLMALDHWSPFARVELIAEGYSGVKPTLGTPGQIFLGLITNLASGIFFTLAGTSIAFFERSRRKRGWTEWEITRFLLIRAAILLVLDQVVNRFGWSIKELPLFEVLSAIGFCIAVLAFARHLPMRAIAGIAIALFLGYPLLVTLFPNDPNNPFSAITTILLQHSRDVPPMVQTPFLSRLSLVLAGYIMGRLLDSGRISISPRWLWVALGGLVAWFVLRLGLLNGYGDFLPYEPGAPWIDLLVDNKQPPSFTFLLFNMSCSLVVLVALNSFSRRLVSTRVGWILTVLGQTSLFFFVAHMLFYRVLEHIFRGNPMIPPALVGNSDVLRLILECGLTLVILVPVCAVYRILRRKYTILSYL